MSALVCDGSSLLETSGDNLVLNLLINLPSNDQPTFYLPGPSPMSLPTNVPTDLSTYLHLYVCTYIGRYLPSTHEPTNIPT